MRPRKEALPRVLRLLLHLEARLPLELHTLRTRGQLFPQRSPRADHALPRQPHRRAHVSLRPQHRHRAAQPRQHRRGPRPLQARPEAAHPAVRRQVLQERRQQPVRQRLEQKKRQPPDKRAHRAVSRRRADFEGRVGLHQEGRTDHPQLPHQAQTRLRHPRVHPTQRRHQGRHRQVQASRRKLQDGLQRRPQVPLQQLQREESQKENQGRRHRLLPALLRPGRQRQQSPRNLLPPQQVPSAHPGNSKPTPARTARTTRRP